MNKLFVKKNASILLGMVLFLLMSLSLSSCSTPIVSEVTVFEDIKSSDTYCLTFDFEYDSMEITKRQTDEDNKRDTVWVKFVCHNEDFKYEADYIVTYILYNDGWLFENLEITNSNYTATTTPDEQTVIAKIQKEYDINAIITEQNSSEKNKCIFLATATIEEGAYLKIHHQIHITYSFTPQNGWHITDENYNTNNDWNKLIGKWTNENNEIEVLSTTSSSITIVLNEDKTIGLENATGSDKCTINSYDDKYFIQISLAGKNGHGLLRLYFDKNGISGYTKVS